MDDMLILAPTRWTLRQAVREVNQVLGALDLEKAPDKTFIGRIEKGFDFLGYHLRREGVCAAHTTRANAVSNATRLYEHGASPERIGAYWRRFHRWLQAGISSEIPRLAMPGSADRG